MKKVFMSLAVISMLGLASCAHYGRGCGHCGGGNEECQMKDKKCNGTDECKMKKDGDVKSEETKK
jgi:hypothetical protein